MRSGRATRDSCAACAPGAHGDTEPIASDTHFPFAAGSRACIQSRQPGSLWRITSMIPDCEPFSMQALRPPIYHSLQMRRGFSILLIAIFSLGPLTALSSASEEASLPACCRRNGKHRCARASEMTAAAVSMAPGGRPVWNAPQHCPYFPQNATVRNAPVHALTVSSPGVPMLLARARRVGASRPEPLFNPVNPLAGRGPPA